MNQKEIKPIDNLKIILSHEDNNPLEFIQVHFEELQNKTNESGWWEKDKKGNPILINKKEKRNILFYTNIKYCCFDSNNLGPKKEVSIEQREEWLMNTFKDQKSCVLIFIKFDTLKKFRAAFSREMHWINQTSLRRERFDKISKKIFKLIEANVKEIGEVEIYVEKYYTSLVNMLPVNPRKVELDSMNRTQLLEELATGKITTKEADVLIKNYEAKEYEKNRDKLCPFSGNGFNAAPTRICSRTNNPKILGPCESCRVAAEWEEIYG